ncbi:PREDICTED: nucleolar protein 7 [Cyprinodon variegatus]|uniref:nucleolar protein 7 n=1 Tax=Cyprinodon variegatus TaxID=28743 RepID=UPI0007428305|nr:PREDICTED: nucleolar protein 7 [Cyprinodon variegatus]
MTSLRWSPLDNMVKKQRGKSASSQKRADNKKVADNFKLAIESSDEDAPEEVTFEESKAQAFESLKQAVESARREKEQLREKRRKRQEFFQEQKKRKFLPADVLEKIDSTPLEEQKRSEDEGKVSSWTQKLAEEEVPENDDDEEEEGSAKRKKGKLSGVRSLKGNYTVTTVKEQEAANFQRQVAEDFIRSRLYGAGSCRSTSNELLSLQNKRGPSKSAAVQFVKKGWACKEKAKAEKLNKRWIQTQQVPSS